MNFNTFITETDWSRFESILSNIDNNTMTKKIKSNVLNFNIEVFKDDIYVYSDDTDILNMTFIYTLNGPNEKYKDDSDLIETDYFYVGKLVYNYKLNKVLDINESTVNRFKSPSDAIKFIKSEYKGVSIFNPKG